MLRNIRLFYIHNFLTDFRPQFVFMVIYFAEVTGSYTQAMTIIALEMVVSAFMDIPGGVFSDKVGRKYTLALASLCIALGIALYALANGFWLLCAGAFFSGLSRCLFNGNNDALLYETLLAKKMEAQFHHYQGRTGSMFQLALCLSALAASLLAGYGLRMCFIVGVIPQIFAVIVSLMFEEARVHVAEERKHIKFLVTACRSIYKNPKLLLLVVGQAISYGAGESGFMFKTALVNTVWPTWAVGLYRAINHSLGFAGFWWAGRIIDRIGKTAALVIPELYWFFTQTCAVIIANFFTPILFLSGTIFFGPFSVARDVLLQQDFTDEQRATMSSVASFSGSLFYAFMSIAIGLVSDHFGAAAGVGFATAICALSLPIYIRLFRKHRQEAGTSSA